MPVQAVGGSVMLYSAEHRTGRNLWPPGRPAGGWIGSFLPQMQDFAAAVLQGRSLAAPAEEALGELRVALAIYRSVDSGKWENIW
jgi:predicted dehydrogenase